MVFYSVDIFWLAGFIGTIAFAVSGYLLGVRKDLDWVGIFIVAMLTANGGGMVRDVLVGKTPALLTDLSAFLIVLGVVVFSLITRIHRFASLEGRLFFVLSDSIGLVAFSITGAQIGLEHELSLFGVIVLALLTATGGGIIRDILLNEVPTLLNSGFYGSIAIIVGVCLYFLEQLSISSGLAVSILFVLALLLRMTAHFRNWHLPKVKKYLPPA